MANTGRRKFITGAAVAAAAAVPSKAQDKPTKKVIYRDGKKPEKTPLFNGIVTFGNLVFIAGIGATSRAASKSTPSMCSIKLNRV